MNRHTRLQQEKARGATDRIGQYLFDLEQKIGAAAFAKDGISGLDRRMAEIQLLRRTAAIREITLLDPRGIEVLRVSPFSADVLRSGRDLHGLARVECDSGGTALSLHGTIQDITERKQMEDQVRQLAFNDPLTELPNRRLLNDRLNQTHISGRRTGSFGALMFLDLDNFKPLNDRYGHAIGDLLLIEAAQRLTQCVRKADTVSRFGGDEFVVMLCELSHNRAEATEQARVVAEKIRGSLAEPYRLSVRIEGSTVTTIEHRCSASIGVLVFNCAETTADHILKGADAAMYQAKDAGRNLVRLFADMDQS